MTRLFAPSILAFLLTPMIATAQEYTVVPLEEAAPAEDVSPEILAELQPTGLKVMKGGTRTVCQLWLRKSWPVLADFNATPSTMYPFQVGELIGVMRFTRSSAAFRDQQIASGVYTVRYALQPEDGNHVGTSDTRDFLLLLPAAQDRQPKIASDDELITLSKEAAGTTHPAMLSLLAADASAETPGVEEDTSRELTALRVKNATTGGKQGELTIKIVVVGHAAG